MIEWLRHWLMSLEPWGAEVIVWAQAWSTPFLDRAFNLAAFLGDEEFFFVLLPLVYWSVNKKTGRLLAYGLLISTYLNSIIKHLFMILRPDDPRILVMRPVDPPNPCLVAMRKMASPHGASWPAGFVADGPGWLPSPSYLWWGSPASIWVSTIHRR